jgi:hypothetical protein
MGGPPAVRQLMALQRRLRKGARLLIGLSLVAR